MGINPINNTNFYVQAKNSGITNDTAPNPKDELIYQATDYAQFKLNQEADEASAHNAPVQEEYGYYQQGEKNKAAFQQSQNDRGVVGKFVSYPLEIPRLLGNTTTDWSDGNVRRKLMNSQPPTAETVQAGKVAIKENAEDNKAGVDFVADTAAFAAGSISGPLAPVAGAGAEVGVQLLDNKTSNHPDLTKKEIGQYAVRGAVIGTGGALVNSFGSQTVSRGAGAAAKAIHPLPPPPPC